jgi:hypothetical protein
MEQDFLDEKLQQEPLTPDEHNNLKQLLTFGKVIEQNWRSFGSIEHFNDSIEQYFSPRINMIAEYSSKRFTDESTKEYSEKYISEVYKLLNFLLNYYRISSNIKKRVFHELIDRNTPADVHSLSLAQKSVLIASSVKGVSTVLAGARKEKYVEEMCALLNHNKITGVEEIIPQFDIYLK